MGAARSRVERAFAVLDAFTPERPSLRLSEIARRAGLPLTTTHRLLAELCALGAVERDRDGTYRVGLRLWEIASLAPRGVPLREAALPFLEDLYEVTHENVQLGVREGQDVVYIERIAGRRAVGVLTRVGGRFPLHASGIGLVLLAHAPDRVQREVLEGPLQRFTDYTITDPALLERVLAQVRRDGVAVSDRQVTDDALSVAAPITGARGEVIAALSIVAKAGDTVAARLAPAVRAAARGTSRALSARRA
ncbi:MAG: IclR family transcriptional regulator [Solirubrobacterales bacterium]|nr:IclR family transcriptional regulator [Solirubrobacterales bacterium]MBV9809131.1 IclR family transcriptional regulator [Solirubrobacterales bacterium]